MQPGLQSSPHRGWPRLTDSIWVHQPQLITSRALAWGPLLDLPLQKVTGREQQGSRPRVFCLQDCPNAHPAASTASFWGTGRQLTEFALVAVVGATAAPGGAVGVGVGVVALAMTIAFLLALRGAVVAVLALVV